ncbi:MAG: ATP-binding cassette domain-containing protein, partial [Mycobacterium sp.]|nr:ATP-binding cassette domain-containing protein [Mycobacterium sp.]
MSQHEPVTGPALAFDDVSVVRGGRTIWSDSTLRIEAGQFVAVIGSNGSGKTTLLKVILGLLPVAHGTVQVYGS